MSVIPSGGGSHTQAHRDIANVLVLVDAAGDGETDDEPTIQAALDATSGGGIVTLPVGTFLLGSRIEVPAAVTLRGSGPGTVLKRGYIDDQLVRLVAASGISDLTIDGAFAELGAHSLADLLMLGDGATADRVTFRNFAHMGIQMVGNHVEVRDCGFYGTEAVDIGYDAGGHRYGIWAISGTPYGQVVRGCYFERMYWNAVLISTSGARIIDCYARDCHVQFNGTGGGMFAAGGPHMRIIGCIADGSGLDPTSVATSGFELNGAGITLTGCSAIDTPYAGVFCQGDDDFTLDDVAVTGCGTGIAVAGDVSRMTVANSRIFGNTTGLSIGAGTGDDIVLTGNRFWDNDTDVNIAATPTSWSYTGNLPTSINGES